MKSIRFSFAIFLMLFTTACKSEPVDLGLMCHADAGETVRWSSAVVYGVEVPPPHVTGAHPLVETDLFGLDIGDDDRLGLLAADASGTLHHRVCSTVLCNVDDTIKALAACADKPGCRIVGAVKLKTFYPLYLADVEDGHICAPRWN